MVESKPPGFCFWKTANTPSTALSGWQSPGCTAPCECKSEQLCQAGGASAALLSPAVSQCQAVSKCTVLLCSSPWAAARLHVESCGSGKRETRESSQTAKQVLWFCLRCWIRVSPGGEAGGDGSWLAGVWRNTPVHVSRRLADCTAWLVWLFLPFQRQLTSLSDRNVLVLVGWPYWQEKTPLNKCAAIWRDNEIQHPPRLLNTLSYERFRAQFYPARLSSLPPRAASLHWLHLSHTAGNCFGEWSVVLYNHKGHKREQQALIFEHEVKGYDRSLLPAQKLLCHNHRKHWTPSMGMGKLFIRGTLIFSQLL